jgi:hypothetical protein
MMKGARHYVQTINNARALSGEYKKGRRFIDGKLLIELGQHARGYTLRVSVISREAADRLATLSPEEDPMTCFNQGDLVEVFGDLGNGQPGWTEEYGWLHEGPWQADFIQYIERCQQQIAAAEEKRRRESTEAEARRAARVHEVLANY